MAFALTGGGEEHEEEGKEEGDAKCQKTHSINMQSNENISDANMEITPNHIEFWSGWQENRQRKEVKCIFITMHCDGFQ